MAPRRKALPAPLPDGWILRDTEKKQWRLGKIIGKGGFGLIYLASDCVDVPVQEDTDYVVKVEFYENGPLFSELKFYQRAAKVDNINKWKKDKRLDFLGIPTYWGSGHSEYNETRYRFMVMDRLGTDLQKVIVENGGQLRKQTVLQLGCLMLDVLEYIHENEYVHADIKAANLLLGYKDPDKVYLADYGLSYRYCPNGEHKEYKENPKKGHNGTIEYTSIDAHKGVASSRRGDLEVLGYCLLHWQCGTLPWLSALRNPAQVQEAKAKLIADLPDSVTQMSTPGFTTEIARFLLSVRALGYNEKPDYQALRKALSEAGPRGPLDLSRPRAVEKARPAVSGNSSPARPSVRSAKPKAVTADEDGNLTKAKSTPARVRYRTQEESKTIDQDPRKARSAPKCRPVAIYSDEDYKEDNHLLSRVHPKTREGTKQRQRHKQKPPLESEAMRTEEAMLHTRKQPNEGELLYRFSHNEPVRDHWGRSSHSWDEYCTSEEEDYHENPYQNHNGLEEGDGHQWSRSENKNYTQWGLKILTIVAVVYCGWLLLTFKHVI